MILFQLSVSAALKTQLVGVDRKGSTEQNCQTDTGSSVFYVWIYALLVGQTEELKHVTNTVIEHFLPIHLHFTDQIMNQIIVKDYLQINWLKK